MEVDLKKRIREHTDLWEYALEARTEELNEAHAAELAQRDAVIAELKANLEAEIEERPVQVVNQYVGQEKIDEALANRDRAYRSRDSAFFDLTRLHMLHFEQSAGRCRCGKPIDDCEEAAILDGSKALRGWEREQTRRRKLDLDHHLPRNHPGVVDARWDPDDDSVTEFVDPAD